MSEGTGRTGACSRASAARFTEGADRTPRASRCVRRDRSCHVSRCRREGVPRDRSGGRRGDVRRGRSGEPRSPWRCPEGQVGRPRCRRGQAAGDRGGGRDPALEGEADAHDRAGGDQASGLAGPQRARRGDRADAGGDDCRVAHPLADRLGVAQALAPVLVEQVLEQGLEALGLGGGLGDGEADVHDAAGLGEHPGVITGEPAVPDHVGGAAVPRGAAPPAHQGADGGLGARVDREAGRRAVGADDEVGLELAVLGAHAPDRAGGVAQEGDDLGVLLQRGAVLGRGAQDAGVELDPRDHPGLDAGGDRDLAAVGAADLQGVDDAVSRGEAVAQREPVDHLEGVRRQAAAAHLDAGVAGLVEHLHLVIAGAGQAQRTGAAGRTAPHDEYFGLSHDLTIEPLWTCVRACGESPRNKCLCGPPGLRGTVTAP